jgi:nicotinamidase/pyrazinamidase
MADALFIIDVQNDFMPPNGALAVPEGDRVIEPINELAASDRFVLVVATRDWHPPDHTSFASHGGPWPRHCVRGTFGAQLHAALDVRRVDVVLDKGTDRTAAGYSAFEVDALAELLARELVEAVTVTGVATDVCVKHTSLDALRENLLVTIPTRAVRELSEAGAEIA